MTETRLKRVEKIVITAEVFNDKTIEKSVKDFLRKLANNYKL